MGGWKSNYERHKQVVEKGGRGRGRERGEGEGRRDLTHCSEFRSIV
jgi:hypothetical protein